MNHPGYTTFVVATLQPDNVTLAGPPPITEFGVYPFVAKTYGYLPEELASEPDNAALDPLKLNLGVLQENCLFVPNQGGGGGGLFSVCKFLFLEKFKHQANYYLVLKIMMILLE